MKPHQKSTTVWFILFLLVYFSSILFAQTTSQPLTKIVSLKYITPSEMCSSLALPKSEIEGFVLWAAEDKGTLRINNNNQVLLTGSESWLQEAQKLIAFVDIPTRQIVIEVKMVQIDHEKLRAIGIDWQSLLDRSSASLRIDRRKETMETKTVETENQLKGWQATLGSTMNLGDFVKMVQDADAGKIINVPHIVTTNNKTGKILDGDRITYVSRYSSYTNLFETQEISAGLSLAVTPSLGESGYLRLDVLAKYTALGQIISGSPSESGQILENTVIVKDQQPFLLGGFKTTETRKLRKKVPLLGSILPFLFSRHVDQEISKDVFIILTPRVIDLKPQAVPEV